MCPVIKICGPCDILAEQHQDKREELREAFATRRGSGAVGLHVEDLNLAAFPATRKVSEPLSRLRHNVASCFSNQPSTFRPAPYKAQKAEVASRGTARLVTQRLLCPFSVLFCRTVPVPVWVVRGAVLERAGVREQGLHGHAFGSGEWQRLAGQILKVQLRAWLVFFLLVFSSMGAPLGA